MADLKDALMELDIEASVVREDDWNVVTFTYNGKTLRYRSQCLDGQEREAAQHILALAKAETGTR